jgi:outer membrane protein OmpA-like peptidoglycan-associated protein
MDRPLLNQNTLLFTFVICCFKLSLVNAFQYTIPTTLEVKNAYTLKAVVGAQIIVKQKESDGKYYGYGIYYTDSLGLISLSLNEGKVYTITTKRANYYTQITVLSTDDISRIGKNKFGLSMRPKDCYRIRGKVISAQPLVGENYLTLKNQASNKSERIDIDEEGDYCACATCGENYLLTPYLNGMEYKIDTLELNEEKCRGKRNPLLELNIVPNEVPTEPIAEVVQEPKVKYATGDSMILRNLVFRGKSENTDERGKEELNSLSKDLLEYPELAIELRVHTDTKKSERYNWLLSKKRGNFMGEYLEEKGINPTRFTITPVGEAEILNDCGNGKPCSKKEHATNNRVELRVLEGNTIK